MKKKLNFTMSNQLRENLIAYSFIGIWIVGFFLLTVIPFTQTLIYSFQEVKIQVGGIQAEFIHFKNFVTIFTTDIEFLDRIRGFIVQIFLYIPIILVFSYLVAVLLNHKLKFRGLFRTIYFLPVIIISGPIVNELFSSNQNSEGILTNYPFLQTLEEILPTWLSQPILGLFTEMIFILWLSGVQILIFVSGLQKIDRSIYEAASIDGANAWETFWKITLPSSSSLITVNVLYSVVTLATFANNPVLRKIKSDMFSASYGYGYASAEAVIYLITILGILLIFGLIYWIFRSRGRRV